MQTPGGSPRLSSALVVAVIAVLAILALLLARVHTRVLHDRLDEHITRADALVAEGRLEDAVVQYRAALQLERDHREAARLLALTLLRLDRLPESESYLLDLLREDPTDGALNRGLARIQTRRGRDVEARAAFQRAIYGQWPDDRLGERMATRFELVDFLTRAGAEEEVLAELLRLRAELPAGRTTEARRTAELLAQHGARELAIETLAAATAASPRDVDLLAQLADYQLRAGRTSEARTTLRRALAIDRRPDLGARLGVVDRVLVLDPTLPRVGIVARTRRARLLLQAIVARTQACASQSEVKELRQAAARGMRRSVGAERAERELTLAAEIWQAAPGCHGEDVETRAIDEVIVRVSAVDAAR